MRLAGLVCTLLVGMATSVHAQQPCTGHGDLVDGRCVCSSPLPADTASGWVGEQCELPVHRLFLDGQDVQESCPGGQLCDLVTPAAPVCFASSIAEMAGTAHHLALALTSNSVDAAVTLRALLTNFTTTTDAATGVTTVTPQAYPNRETVWSFSLHTSHEDPAAQLGLTRRQLGDGAYTGVFLCAESTNITTIVLRAAAHSCPLTLQPNGALLLCSGRGATDTCPYGTCTCTAPYAPPVNWVMTPGLGFEDCSATLQPVGPPGSPLAVASLAPGAWSFFSVALVPEAEVYELHLTAAATEATRGSLVLYLRHEQLPSAGEGQHDAASDTSSSSWWHDLTAHLSLSRGDAAFRSGTWYVGVYNKGSGPVSYTIVHELNSCPGACYGRGTCAAATGTCACIPSASLAPDCSVSSLDLTLGAPLTREPNAFTYDKLVLHGVRDQLHGSETARLTLTASFSTSDADPPGLPGWVTGRPVVLVAPSADAAINATAAGGGPLWSDGVVARMSLAARGTQYSMDVGPWMVAEDGSLHVVVWNPLSSPPRLVGYTLGVVLRAACPGDCSGHGSCDAATGLCTCQSPFLGSDCSVDPAAFADCVPGSRHAVRPDGVSGTCWTPCRPDGSGYDDSGCEELQCDGPDALHGQLRRKGAAVECVEDACAPGSSQVVTDPSATFVCTRRCSCPEDGGACGLEASCQPGTIQCLQGMRLEASTLTCVWPACQEGALQWFYDIDGGSVFRICDCARPEDPTSCYLAPEAQIPGNKGAVVSCLPGFERQGPTAPATPPRSSVATGGTCVRSRRRGGVSGGMVFFYCLLSIALAAGLVVGGKYGLLWYEQYRYGKSVFSHGYVSWPLFGNRHNAGGGADDW